MELSQALASDNNVPNYPHTAAGNILSSCETASEKSEAVSQLDKIFPTI